MNPRILWPIAALVVLGSAAVAYVVTSKSSDPSDPDDASPIAYLRKDKPQPLSGKLSDLLDASFDKRVATQPHPLLGKPAPGFRLEGSDGSTVALDGLLERGPVVLVFYLGYSCDHCVSQLFGLDEDRAYFAELGATIVAVSADPPKKSREKSEKYGRFHFPVASDPTREIAMRYGVYLPAGNGRREWEAHGTFVIDRDKTVLWAETGAEPFNHNPTLLHELTRIFNRMAESR
jgi:peroxiredoxin